MSLSQLPTEVKEEILWHCFDDGNSWIAMRNVNLEWRNIVDSLDELKDVWLKFSYIMPDYEFFQYSNQPDPNWQSIYETRRIWENMKNIDLESNRLETQQKCEKLISIAVATYHIGVGLDSGKVLIFDDDGVLRHEYTCKANCDIVSLHFVEDDEGYPEKLFIICSDLLLIYRLCECKIGVVHPGDVITSHQTFDVCKDFFCGISNSSNVMIIRQVKDCNDETDPQTDKDGHRIIGDVPLYWISSPDSSVQHLRMLSEMLIIAMCYDEIFLILKKQVDDETGDNETKPEYIVRTITFATIFDKGMLHYNTKKMWILNHEVVFSASMIPHRGTSRLQVFEINVNGASRGDVYKPQHILEAMVTHVCLYGNTLVIGTDDSCVYFYVVNERAGWLNFNLANYAFVVELGSTFGPVVCVRVAQRAKRRLFYVASSWGKIEVISGEEKQSIQ